MSFFKDLLKKPRPVRARFALIASVVVTGVIAFAWLFSLPAQFSDLKREGGVGEDSAKESPDSIDSFIQSARSQFTDTLPELEEEEEPQEVLVATSSSF